MPGRHASSGGKKTACPAGKISFEKSWKMTCISVDEGHEIVYSMQVSVHDKATTFESEQKIIGGEF
jgi:hypothetical protein